MTLLRHKEYVCKDCKAEGVLTKRPAPHPGPRCVSHHRLFTKAAKERTHDLVVSKTYGLERGEYDNLYAAQGGKCAICAKATGKARRLAVDHDHKDGRVRGLLCSICNRYLGWMGDNPEAYRRAIHYLDRQPVL